MLRLRYVYTCMRPQFMVQEVALQFEPASRKFTVNTLNSVYLEYIPHFVSCDPPTKRWVTSLSISLARDCRLNQPTCPTGHCVVIFKKYVTTIYDILPNRLAASNLTTWLTHPSVHLTCSECCRKGSVVFGTNLPVVVGESLSSSQCSSLP